MLGPHPRVRLNGVARPLPKLRFGRGTPCVNLPNSGIKNCTTSQREGSESERSVKFPGEAIRAAIPCPPSPSRTPERRRLASRQKFVSGEVRHDETRPCEQCFGAFRLELGATSHPGR
jgi:hypothetical protein